MCWKKIKNEICVEVIAMDEEGTEVIIRKNRRRYRYPRNLHEHI